MTKPEWLTIKPASTEKYGAVKRLLSCSGLGTVCVGAHCPNASECWSAGTATFMVLGDACTRGCRFCAVPKKATGAAPDPAEPGRLAMAVHELKLRYVVVTSVCRDDLEDQGAGHFAACIREIKMANPGAAVEVLIPDFQGNEGLIRRVVEAGPDVVGHNIETVERLTPFIRDRRASYALSLKVLRIVKALNGAVLTKSSMMLGLGEKGPEIFAAMKGLRTAKVDFLALGQYLCPGAQNLPVQEYVTPKKFEELKKAALGLGFLNVASGPFVRSSYRASEFFTEAMASRKANA